MNKKLVIILLISILILVGGVACYYLFIPDKKGVKEVEVVDDIKDYNYVLHDNESELYNMTFKELKAELARATVDDIRYAELISKLFIIDFYTLSNKITNNDIGGVEYFHPDYVDNFINKAKDTVYKYVKSNVYNDRVQDLPTIKSITFVESDNVKFNHDKVIDDTAILIKLQFDYEKDMGYSSEAIITLVHNDKMLYIVEVK